VELRKALWGMVRQASFAWETLRQPLLARNRFGLGDRVREGLRALNRVRRPAGLHLALLGPDGCGKSTLLERLGPILEMPFFRRQLVFHFRPKVFEKGENDAPVTNPHEKPPRSRIAGLAKLMYYFLDNFAGYIAKVFPAKVRNELIIFCRSFDDLLIDPRRYRFHSAGWPARLLHGLLPRPDLTFVLDAEPEQITGVNQNCPWRSFVGNGMPFNAWLPMIRDT